MLRRNPDVRAGSPLILSSRARAKRRIDKLQGRVAIHGAQDGQLELPGDLNEGFKDFSTFMGRFVIVEEALRVSLY